MGRPQYQNNYQKIQKQLCSLMYQHQYFNRHLMTDILRLELQLNIWNWFHIFISLLFYFPLEFFLTPQGLVSLDASEKFQLHFVSIN